VRHLVAAFGRRWGSAGALDNARCAATDASRLRVEREEVAAYLDDRAARRTA
jgi:hypothetical protein